MRFTATSLLSAFVCTLAAAWAAAPLAPPAPPPPPAPRLEPFTNLPASASRPAAAPQNQYRLRAGTSGLALPAPVASVGRTTIAIFGDLAPANAGQREKLLRTAVAELNLLRPEAVLTVGNLIPGLTRSGPRYVADVQHARALLDGLQMPWFPCAGITDVVSGTRMPASPPAPGDRRFEDLYQRYLGPLYFSADIGGTDSATGTAGTGASSGIHAIVLDSEEGVGVGNTISDAQLRWLAGDLNHTFDAGRAQAVILLLHRPLWREEKSGGNWQKVHDLLVAFNRRPSASFEGAGGTLPARGPRALAVFAGARLAYSQEPLRDGIRYYVLGPTAAVPHSNESPAEVLQHFTLIKLDAAGEMHTALIQLGAADAAQMILPEDAVTAPERAIIDALAAWDDTTLGIDGIVDERGDPLAPAAPRLTFHATNPLPEALDIQLRLALGTGGAATWDFTTVPLQHHLTAAGTSGASISWVFSLRRIRAGTDRPVVEALIRWPDPRGRVHEIILPRPITVAPTVVLPVSDKPLLLDTPDGWPTAPGSETGIATSWNPRPDAPQKPDPTITLRADGEHLFVRAHVTDDIHSYWPVMKLDSAWGGLPSDAVSLAWSRPDKQIQRIWLLPFAPTPTELWTNTGLGTQQTDLQRLSPNSGIQAAVKSDPAGYTVTFALPRKLVCEETPASQPGPSIPLLTPPPPATRLAATALLNIAVHDNDETARTWAKSWTREESGPDAWAHIQLIQSEAPQPGFHLP